MRHNEKNKSVVRHERGKKKTNKISVYKKKEKWRGKKKKIDLIIIYGILCLPSPLAHWRVEKEKRDPAWR